MKLGKQVVSLDLAKRLKELGVRQESLFAHTAMNMMPDTSWEIWTSGSVEEWVSDGRVAAFTVAELGEMFPGNTEIDGRGVYFIHQKGLMGNLQYSSIADMLEEKKNGIKIFEADTEADARAKMLIYLLENKLMADEPHGTFTIENRSGGKAFEDFA